jgi:hypothetical protein
MLPDQDSNLDSTDSESDVLASYTIGQWRGKSMNFKV